MIIFHATFTSNTTSDFVRKLHDKFELIAQITGNYFRYIQD